jgi:hypothetical protein
MKTDDLIKALAEDTARPQPLWRGAAAGAAIAVLGAAALFFAFIGIRDDAGTALETWRFIAKLVFVAAVLFVTAWEFRRMLRPQAQPRLWPLAAMAMVLAAAVILELILIPQTAWGRTALGTNALACLTTIPFLSAVPLAAAIWTMRQGAPAAPAAAGAIAGGVSASLGAFLYATHCTDDSALFVALWYPMAASLVIGAGALVGRLALRW